MPRCRWLENAYCIELRGKGKMSVHQLKDGRFFVKYAKGTNKNDPTRQREYFGRGLEAEDAAIRRNLELGLGVVRQASGPTFRDIANEYLEAKLGTMPSNSADDLAWKLDGVILPILGHLQASMVKPAELDKYIQTRRSKGIKLTSIHRELSTVRAIIRRAVERHLIADNPMTGFAMPRRDDAVIPPPTSAEVAAIYRVAAPHLQRAIMLGTYTAMRPGGSELLALRWEHIDLINGSIFVESAKKGGMRARVVPIAEGLRPLLAGWMEVDRSEGKPLSWVVHYHGRHIGSLKTAWEAAKKRANITRRCRMYDLRHMAATSMLDAGADLKSVSEILGHASPDMTMKIYQHTSTKLRKDAISKLGNWLPSDQK